MGPSKKNKKPTGKTRTLILSSVILVLAVWVIVRPGVFTVQPVGAVPEGVTVLYHSRYTGMPFFASPDSLCLKVEGSVSLLCRMTALSALEQIKDRTILQMPYSHWTYLRSTGGVEYEEYP